MASGLLKDYLGYGAIASRPATPSLSTGTAGYWYATDTNTLSVWSGATWTNVGGGSLPSGLMGGATGQVLTKLSGTDYNFGWQTPGGGGGTVGPHRYWRFISCGKDSETFTGFSGMELHATVSGSNIATGGTSLSYPDIQASGGNIWGGNGTSDFFQFFDQFGVFSWVGYDLGSGNASVVLEFTMYPAIASTNRAPNHFAIEASDNGIAWRRIAAYSVARSQWTANTQKTFAVPSAVY